MYQQVGSIRFRLTIVGSFMLACLVSGGTQSGGQRSSTTAVEKMIRAIHAGMTITELRNALPSETRIGEPGWHEDDQAVGNVAQLSGKVKGLVVFLSRKQISLLNRDGYELSRSERAFRDTDPVESIQIHLGPAQSSAETRTEKLIKDLSKSFGRPKERKRVMGDFTPVHGWYAAWRLTGHMRLRLWEHWYGHDNVLMVDTQRR